MRHPGVPPAIDAILITPDARRRWQSSNAVGAGEHWAGDLQAIGAGHPSEDRSHDVSDYVDARQVLHGVRRIGTWRQPRGRLHACPSASRLVHAPTVAGVAAP